MINVDVISDHKPWNKKLKNKSAFFNKLLSFFPKKYLFKNKRVNLTVNLSNNHEIKKLNKKFRNKNKATDVLSFPFEKILKRKEIYLGDIIISFQFINKPKKTSKLGFKEKVVKIFIHGFLHLLNYDHIKLKDYKKMSKEEVRIYKFINKKIEKLN